MKAEDRRGENGLFDEAHIFRMTDDTGMFQHAKFSVPNLAEGYTTDDMARALIMAVMLFDRSPKPAYLALVYRYLGFILYAQNDSGQFRNFMTYNRQFTETAGSEDCFGRCLWALGYTQASAQMPLGVKEACAGAFSRALRHIHTLKWLRGQAYALIGLGFVNGRQIDSLMAWLAEDLVSKFEHCTRDKDWDWFEDSLTYSNAVLPWSLFSAYGRLRKKRMLYTARESLEFLDKITFRDGYFRPVGCNGWLKKGGELAQYDQQPVEACAATMAHLAAYEVTGDCAMLALARRCFAWYAGENSQRQSLIDQETGGCCDGITPEGINRNQGAESIVGYIIAGLSLGKYENAAGKAQV